jgi:hypothetical protein
MYKRSNNEISGDPEFKLSTGSTLQQDAFRSFYEKQQSCSSPFKQQEIASRPLHVRHQRKISNFHGNQQNLLINNFIPCQEKSFTKE